MGVVVYLLGFFGGLLIPTHALRWKRKALLVEENNMEKS